MCGRQLAGFQTAAGSFAVEARPAVLFLSDDDSPTAMAGFQWPS
jgi:hypothetical protein